MVFKKGMIAWNKGIPRTKETKDKISKKAKKYFETFGHPFLGKKHSEETKVKISKSRKGKYTGNKNPNWKGGIIYRSGYIKIYLPEHPMSNKYGYIKRSRLNVEKKIGRYLLNTEKVHHINGIKDDDRIENLKIMNDSEHKKLHAMKLNRVKGIFNGSNQ